jgi:hypothetical protein
MQEPESISEDVSSSLHRDKDTSSGSGQHAQGNQAQKGSIGTMGQKNESPDSDNDDNGDTNVDIDPAMNFRNPIHDHAGPLPDGGHVSSTQMFYASQRIPVWVNVPISVDQKQQFAYGVPAGMERGFSCLRK